MNITSNKRFYRNGSPGDFRCSLTETYAFSHGYLIYCQLEPPCRLEGDHKVNFTVKSDRLNKDKHREFLLYAERTPVDWCNRVQAFCFARNKITNVSRYDSMEVYFGSKS